jgi:hypothetical protein
MPKSIFVSNQLLQILVFAIYLIMYYGNKKLPYVHDDKSAFIGLFIIGFVMCMFGIFMNIPALNWGNIYMILAAIVGTIAFAVTVLSLMQINILSLTNYKFAFNVLSVIIIFKLIITSIHHLVKAA